MLNDPNFEVMEFLITTEEVSDKVVGITFSHVNEKDYNGIILGLDYNYLKSHDLYKNRKFIKIRFFLTKTTNRIFRSKLHIYGNKVRKILAFLVFFEEICWIFHHF